jgi:1-phosphofructokinase
MITVTLNPSIDRTFDVAGLEVGGVNRALRTHLDAGGKGINVSRGLHQSGLPTVAVFPVGGPDGQVLVSELEATGVPIHPVRIAGSIRTNVTLADESGVTTKVNAPGPELSDAELDALLDAVAEELIRGARCVVAAGSLPASVPVTFLDRLAQLAAEHRTPYAVDTSGAPLARAVSAGGLAVVKPNDEELAELVGRDLVTVRDVVAASHEVLARRNDAVLVSLGAHGALLTTVAGTWWAGGEPLVPVSTVGAGDSTLVGWLSADGSPDPERLRTAVAWGRAAVQLPGTQMPRPQDLDVASVRVVADPDLALTLKEL